MRTMEKMRKFVKRYETRLLLLAVLLTAGAALRTAAYAKYNSYLEDSSSAVAGDFYFTSDYLAEGVGMTHYITTCDGEHYDCPIRIQNYENSLRYNHADTDFFYTVEGAVYTDPSCNEEFRDTFYDSQNGGSITAYYGGTSNPNLAVTDDDGIKYGLLCGTEQFSTENGAQTIRVSCDRATQCDSSQIRYFKVTLRTVPLYKANELQAQLPANLKANYNTTRGVYYGELSCVFVLSRSTEDASVTESLHKGSDYTIRYTLSCKSGNADVRVYYDHTKVVPDGALGAIGIENENGKRYITTHVQSSAETDCYFFLLNLGSTVDINDFSFKVLSGAESEDDTVRAINVPGGWTVTDMSGNDLSGGAQAKTMVKLTPPQNPTQVIAALSVTPEGLDTPISTTFVEDGNYYYFEMPGSAVNVTPTWHYTTRITVTPDGDIIHGQIVQPSPVAAGAAVVLTIQPDDGYQLGTISVKDSAGVSVNLTTILEGLTYQFDMPAGGANVSASFVAAQAPEEP